MQEINKIFIKIPQPYLDLVNQVFEIEKKANSIQETNSIHRNIKRLKDLLENELFRVGAVEREVGISYHNPLGEKYDETRTDCEASIAGSDTENLEIVEVIKPIIFYSFIDNDKPRKTIAQKGVVIVKSINN